MAAKTPLEVDQLFAKALEAGDLEAIVALYEPQAVVPGQSGQPPAVGPDQIREAMRPFIDLKPTNIVLAANVVAEVDGMAILYDDWRGTGHAPDGSEHPLTFVFNVDGDKVTGTIQAQGEAIPIDNVKMNGTEITFDASEDDGTVMIHTGKYYADGDSIAMNLNYQGMRLHATLKRADK